MTVILGIDPGLKCTGWGVINVNGNHIKYVSCGKIISNHKEVMPRRLKSLSEGIKEVLSTYFPDECAVEETFLNKNPMSSLRLGHARGALILSVSLLDIPLYEYAATLVKKSIVGVGRADKIQMQMMVKQLLPEANVSSEDATDALAVAICHANHINSRYVLEGVL